MAGWLAGMAKALPKVAEPADWANAVILARYWGMAGAGADVNRGSGWWFIVDIWVIMGLVVWQGVAEFLSILSLGITAGIFDPKSASTALAR
jgi:hypothetical protein